MFDDETIKQQLTPAPALETEANDSAHFSATSLPTPSNQGDGIFTLHKACELVAPPVSWTVDQIVPSGMLTVLSGKDKMGKTLLAWEIARVVTQGQPFLGHFQVQSGPVVFAALDDPAIVTTDRRDQLGLAEAPNLYIATPTGCIPEHDRFWGEVEDRVREINPQLVIVDALYKFLRGGTSALNEAGAMAPLMEPLNRIPEQTGCGLMLITHDTKVGNPVAGSFVIRAAAKQILHLRPHEPNTSRRILGVEGKIIEKGQWVLDFAGPGEWSLVDGDRERLTGTMREVTAWLEEGNRGTAGDIADATHKRRADVETVLKQLLCEGNITVNKEVSSGRGRPRQTYHWLFSPSPASS